MCFSALVPPRATSKESGFRVLSFSVPSYIRPPLQDDRRIEIEFVLVVLPRSVLLVASKGPQHVKVRKMVLDTLQRQQRRRGVRLRQGARERNRSNSLDPRCHALRERDGVEVPNHGVDDTEVDVELVPATSGAPGSRYGETPYTE